MTELDEAIQRVKMRGGQVLIPCEDVKSQESTRVMLFGKRKKYLPNELIDTIGIKKFSYNNQLFIKVYERTFKGLYTLNDEGIPVLLPPAPEHDPELQRRLRLMRTDGIPEEIIRKEIDDWLEEHNGEELTPSSYSPKKEERHTVEPDDTIKEEKAEMLRLAKEDK